MPAHADEVSEVEQLEDLECALGQRILPDVDLDPRLAVGKDEEIRLAEAPHRQDPPSRRGLHFRRLELGPRFLAELHHEVVDRVSAIEGVRVGIDPEPHQLIEVGSSLFLLIV